MPAPPTLVKAIVNGVTPNHNPAHEALERRFDLGGTPNVANVAEWGADMTGAVDGSAVVNEMYAAGERDIYIPLGRLKVTLDAVVLGSDVIISGPGTIFTTQTTAGALLTFPAGSTNVTVCGPTFEAPNDRIVAVKVLSAASEMSSDIVIAHNHCINARLVVTNDLTITYAGHSTHATTGTVTRDVRIVGNTGTRTGANLTNLAFILLWYTVGAEVHDNRLVGYGYGIQWWGGDANPVDGDGDLANERKCGDLTITGNRVKGMLDVLGGGGGIWGSMGRNITANGNVIDDCADVGLDFEGCDTWNATGNTVTNCVNGCLTTFFYNRNGEFGPNTCRQDNAAASPIIARIQNNYPTSENEGVTFTGGSFSCSSGIAMIAFETAQRATIRGATLRNVRITAQINNIRNTTIDRCSLLFTVAAGAALNAINVGYNNLGGRAIVTGNTVESLVAQPAGSRAIRTEQADQTRDVLEFIDDNILLGWSTPIETIWDGANAGFKAITFIRRNTIDAGATIVNTRGPDSLATGVAATIIKEGNRYADGTAVP